MAVTNRDIEKHIAELKRRMDFDGANEMRRMQEAMYQQYMKEMRSNPLYGSQINSVGLGTGIGIGDWGASSAHTQRQRKPELDVLRTPYGSPSARSGEAQRSYGYA